MADRRKPISFNTTLRNPERIPQFVSILTPFEGQILNDEVALEIEAKIIINKIFEPTPATLGTYVLDYDDKFHYEAEDKTREAPLKVREYYTEWTDSMSTAEREVFEKQGKIHKNKSSDKNQHDRYKGMLGKDIPNSLVNNPKLKLPNVEKAVIYRIY